MFDEKLKELVSISRAVGSLPDMVQAGGGNTSVKLNDELMAVKASGYKLNQVTEKEGYVVINYKDIKEYYRNVDMDSGTDYEKDSVDFAIRSIVKINGLDNTKTVRPSVEAGFHSFLKTYVIHTHSVYANILCCSKQGERLMGDIFSGWKDGFMWMPYINPGFSLTLAIREGIEKNLMYKEKVPEVIFMENHGLIVSSDDCHECVELNEKVNNAIRDYLGIKGEYPKIKLEKVNDTLTESKTEYLDKFFRRNGITGEYFNKIVLYPDQLVYLNENVSVNGIDNKLIIDAKTGRRVYKTGFQESLAIEETLLAYVYIIEKIRECGLELKIMDDKGADFIRNWESEKYRKELIKNK